MAGRSFGRGLLETGNAAAELIVQLAGNDASRWSTVLDKLHLIPEAHRNQLD